MLLNHLFGNRKGKTAKKLQVDAQKRLQLWQEHLANFKQREELVRLFNHNNVNAALPPFNLSSVS